MLFNRPLLGKPLLGALDMGGSSTQLIFFNGSSDARKIHADDFWSYSWLSYGAHKVQERVLEYIYASSVSEKQSQPETCGDDQVCEHQPDQIITIPNPCGFVGHTVSWKNAMLQGTGEGKKCFEMIERVIWPAIPNMSDINGECFKGRPCPIEEIEHPSVKGHHFYAMSVYFFALDCMRQLGPVKLNHW